jgi:T5SS/PEP-CTERM-associated repeat protein
MLTDVLSVILLRAFLVMEATMRQFRATFEAAMTRSTAALCALLTAVSLAGPLQPALAAITPEGDVSPSDPSTWDDSTDGYIGNTVGGTLTVDDGSDLLSSSGHIGFGTAATGVVNITGTTSSWTTNGNFYVGDAGSGTLSIADGSYVRNYYSSYIGNSPSSTGVAIVSGSSSWTIGSDFCVGNFGSGTLSIVSGARVTGHSSGAYTAYVGNSPASTGIVTVEGAGSTWSNPGDLYVGNSGSGTLSITSGGSVSNVTYSIYTYVGYSPGSNGVITVDGTGSTWNASTCQGVYIGKGGNGTLSITNGGSVSGDIRNPGFAYIGYDPGSKGVVTVDGAASTWSVYGSSLCVGWSGSATLFITNGGGVSQIGDTQIGPAGMIDFGTNGGTLTTGALYASPSQFAGTGTIVANGLVADIDLKFDASHGLAQTIPLQKPGQNVTLNLHASGRADALGAGWLGHGSLTIQDGIVASSFVGYIGCGSGSTGVATVSGSGSTWKIDRWLCVGDNGSGTLSIANGGSVTCNREASFIGYLPGSTGVVKVDGAGSIWDSNSGVVVGNQGSGTLSIIGGGTVQCSGSGIGSRSGSTGLVMVNGTGSTWTNNSNLHVGISGSGTLSITGGAAVAATNVSVGNSTSLAAVDVGRGSLLSIGGGTGTVTNNGTVRILAGAGVPVDNSIKYAPIAAGTWSGTGTYQPVGGTWDADNHLFTASSVTPGTSSSPISLNLASIQRALVTYDGTDEKHWAVGASFPAAASQTDITFAATAIADAVLGGQEVLGAWTFATTGYDVSASNPIYLSFDVGAKYPADELHVWHYDGSVWTEYSPFDLTYDGTYASFTVTSLSGYAVTPEPGTLVLLAVATLGLIAWVRQRQRSS